MRFLPWQGGIDNEKDASWAVGYQPGQSLAVYYKMPTVEEGDPRKPMPDIFTKGHHQQYNDWQVSQHYREGVACTSCHYVHQLGVPSTRSQTVGRAPSNALNAIRL